MRCLPAWMFVSPIARYASAVFASVRQFGSFTVVGSVVFQLLKSVGPDIHLGAFLTFPKAAIAHLCMSVEVGCVFL
jgi:hypothetical protein